MRKTVNEILQGMQAGRMANKAHSSLYCDEVVELAVSHEALYDLILSAYDLGFYRGSAAEKNKRRKSRKK